MRERKHTVPQALSAEAAEPMADAGSARMLRSEAEPNAQTGTVTAGRALTSGMPSAPGQGAQSAEWGSPSRLGPRPEAAEPASEMGPGASGAAEGSAVMPEAMLEKQAMVGSGSGPEGASVSADAQVPEWAPEAAQPGGEGMQILPILYERPSEKQRRFLTARQRYVAYGGARGGGKSWAVRRKAVVLCCKYGRSAGAKGIQILIVRRTLQELRENHILPLIEATRGVAKYSEKDHSLLFCNGSRIRLGYLDTENDALQYQGQEYDVIFIDEATQLTEQMFHHLKGCCRGTHPGFPRRIYLTCNPGGVGHGWVKRLFVDRQFRGGECPQDYCFIQARVEDNPVLCRSNPGYLEMLDSLPEPLRRAWRDGCWDGFAGAFFPEFDRAVHVVDPFEIPRHWRRYMAIDYGLDMLAAVWSAVDEEGNLYVYRAVQQPDLIVSEACRLMRSWEREDGPVIHYAPPDLWGREAGTGRSLIDLFAENGMVFARADNQRVPGWAAVKEYLAGTVRGSAGGKEQTAPGIRFFRGRCEELCRCLQLLAHDAGRPGDCMTVPHEITHSPDALRYLCIMRKRSADGVSALPDLRFSPEGMIRRRAARGSRRVRHVWGELEAPSP